jgi:hypothetical protein
MRAPKRGVGSKLSSEAAKLGSTPRSGVDTANPITVTTSDFRSVPPDSALGLSAFYISLLALMCGFLGAVLVNSSIDAALGYGTSEIGPRWRQRMPVTISRWQTLLTKWSVALVTVPILTGILLLVAVGLLNMNAPHVGELWLFMSFAGIAIAAGTLALFAAFGSPGHRRAAPSRCKHCRRSSASPPASSRSGKCSAGCGRSCTSTHRQTPASPGASC